MSIDIDKLSDDEFEEYLNSGDFEADEIDDETAGEEDQGKEYSDDQNDDLDDDGTGDGADDSDDDSSNDEGDEDTDHDDDSDDDDSDDSDTNDDDDGDDQDTDGDDEGDSDDDGEENAQVGDDSSKDADDDSDETDDEKSGDDDSKSKDGTDTEGDSDGKNQDTDEIDYKTEYDKYKGFYDEVTSEFTANGKKMKGFDDPKKIIQSQQMAAGFSEKMAGFKQYRPYMAPLKERGMLENQTKFELAMSLIDGDKEALKQHIKNLEIDPMELDLEEINYVPQNTLASKAEISYEDMIESAQSHGIKDKVMNVIGEQWDKESAIELLNDPQSGSDLIEHISNGAYDAVQKRIAEKKRVDVNGSFTAMNSISQYRDAAKELESEYVQMMQAEQQAAGQKNNEKIEADKIEAEKAKIEEARKQEEYKNKVQKKNNEANEARKKAASVSKKKPKAKVKKKNFDPMAMSDEDFQKQIDSMIYDN